MKTISLTQGKVALVDDADWENLARYNWHAHKRRNHRPKYEPVRYMGSRRNPTTKSGWSNIMVTMAAELMGTKSALTIDHVDGNPLNNQRHNLRWADRVQQSRNRSKPNNLGYKGVFRNGSGFAARIKVEQRRIYLGTFATLEQAAQEYNKAAKQHFGEFAKLNPV